VSDLYDLLTAVRSHYVEQFVKALEEMRSKGHVLIVEPPMLDAEGELAREGALNLPGRFDLVLQEDDRSSPSMFSPERMLEFQAMAFAGGGMQIEIGPFSWDGVLLTIDGPPQAIAASLAEWFNHAIAAPDDVSIDGIQHAAHFLSDPVVEGETSLVQADFGTVDVDIVIDLLDRLRLAGATRVELSLPTG
jgi:hypothetical protein